MPKKTINALITGGTRGIGRSVALALAEITNGLIIVNYLQDDREAEKTSRFIEEKGCRCIKVKANLLHLDEIDNLINIVKENIETLNIFIHCAALGTFKPLKDIKPNQWDMTININARSFLYISQKIVPLMENGKIIAISSLGGQRVVNNYGAMGPTKAALEAIVRYLAVELAPSGIQVNGVIGGFVRTDSISKFPDADKFVSEAITKTPLKRIGTPEDITGVVMFLISPQAQWVYGQLIVADGGISLM